MLGRICMTLQPADIVCAVTDDPSVKIKYMEMKNVDLKYGESLNSLVWSVCSLKWHAQTVKGNESLQS